MTLSTENILLVGSLLLLISIIAGSTSYRFGVPTLILFLLIGMISGSEGLGGIYFDDPKIAQFVGIISLNFILFSGGLDTSWKTVKPIMWQGVLLATAGVLITALSLGAFVWWVTDFSLLEGMLLGAIVSSTDAAAVFSILRSKSLSLKGNLRPTLELESGSNDPMAYVLTISFLALITMPETSPFKMGIAFVQQMALGTLAGFAMGFLSKQILNRIKLGFDGLYPVLVIALMFITFSLTDFLGGNGFLAIYLCAVYLGNQDIIHKNGILKMFDGLAWLFQIVLFLTLGLLVFPSKVLPFVPIGIVISLFLIFVARPLAVFTTLSPFSIGAKAKLFISWVGLRGAVPIVFATYPLLAGIDKAHTIFSIVFFVSLSSVLVQGTTLSKVAKWLKLTSPEVEKDPYAQIARSLHEEKSEKKDYIIVEGAKVIGRKVVELHFPPHAEIAMITRDGKYLIPEGNTIIIEGDQLTVLADNGFTEVDSCLL